MRKTKNKKKQRNFVEETEEDEKEERQFLEPEIKNSIVAIFLFVLAILLILSTYKKCL